MAGACCGDGLRGQTATCSPMGTRRREWGCPRASKSFCSISTTGFGLEEDLAGWGALKRIGGILLRMNAHNHEFNESSPENKFTV